MDSWASAVVRPLSDSLLQNLSGSNIGEDASNVRNSLRLLAATELPAEAQEAGRTEVLPVQWRKHLRLDASALACTACHDSSSPPYKQKHRASLL